MTIWVNNCLLLQYKIEDSTNTFKIHKITMIELLQTSKKNHRYIYGYIYSEIHTKTFLIELVVAREHSIVFLIHSCLQMWWSKVHCAMCCHTLFKCTIERLPGAILYRQCQNTLSSLIDCIYFSDVFPPLPRSPSPTEKLRREVFFMKFNNDFEIVWWSSWKLSKIVLKWINSSWLLNWSKRIFLLIPWEQF